VEIVNLVNYKIYMNYKNQNPEENKQLTQTEDAKNYYQKGVYVRDDHCDWGSSGMNEFTNEYSEGK